MTRSAKGLGAIKGSLQFPQQPGRPWGVAVSPLNGAVFVSDRDKSQIHVFDAERKHFRTFGQHGEGGQLNCPLGMDVSATGQVYVANQWNCVSVFREDGTFIGTIGRGNSKIRCPWDVLIHSSGLIYLTDHNNHRIAVFSQEGELVRTFGSMGGGKGEFRYPTGIATSPDGHHLYVSDRDNHRVQVFTLEGQFVREFDADQLKGPCGLAVASDGSVLVADYGNKRVAVFDKKGNLVHSFEMNMKLPVYLTVDNRGDLLATFNQEQCVYCF